MRKLIKKAVKPICSKAYTLHPEDYWEDAYNKGLNGISYGNRPNTENQEKFLKTTLCYGRTLEIGAGTGYWTRKMRGWGLRVRETDLVIGEKYDITKEPLKETFDNIVAIGVMHHIKREKELRKALQNMKQMSKNIILGVKLPDTEYTPEYYETFWKQEIYEQELGECTYKKKCNHLTMLLFTRGENE